MTKREGKMSKKLTKEELIKYAKDKKIQLKALVYESSDQETLCLFEVPICKIEQKIICNTSLLFTLNRTILIEDLRQICKAKRISIKILKRIIEEYCLEKLGRFENAVNEFKKNFISRR